MNHMDCDVLIVGGGGAALYAALRTHEKAPSLKIVVASKGLFGKSGCTRMVQGGYNVVLNPQDSFEKHYDDTLRGGSLLNDQELAWTLVNEAPERIYELENRFGCYFDRNEDGTIHQRALAGQSFNRTIHRGDLTGIELMSRLSEQVVVRDITVLNEVRGLDLLFDRSGEHVAGALLLDTYEGSFIAVNAKATLIATGGAAPLYRVTAASLEKSGDGMAMAYRAGARFVDMEMMQFHPTGLIASGSVMNGTVLEEGLRGAGGHLLNAEGERYMQRYDPAKMERSTRDRVSRSGFMEIRAGRGSPEEGVFLDVRHLGKEFLLRSSPGMYKRCLSLGYDMAEDLIQVTPTAHFQMGGVKIDPRCATSLNGLYAAGEDSGGVHGANRLGGNGVAESMVFGGVAGESLAEHAQNHERREIDPDQLGEVVARYGEARPGSGDAFALRRQLGETSWVNLGVIRSQESLSKAAFDLEEINAGLEALPVPENRAGDIAFLERLDTQNLVSVATMMRVAATLRQESRGSHYRTDCTETDPDGLYNIFLQRKPDGEMSWEKSPVKFTRRQPEDLLGDTAIPTAPPRMEARTEA
jgi:succinate dehydrogenase / fumarate reductase flavoprotein subunit/fumarate reductase flavoprotein subunit